jgi:3-phenylpropionate/trans-cinnamate dioxygenase ferredoxin reductase subunit
MPDSVYKYIIVGGGLAGGYAVQGIREIDRTGPILMIGDERHLPYDRPPLTKQLWFGKKKVEDIFVKDWQFYDQNGVTLIRGKQVVRIDPPRRTVTDSGRAEYQYERLLLATGGRPRVLPIPGGQAEGVCYYRNLDDYLRMRSEAAEGKRAVVIGGGFIGSEIAAALRTNKVDVAMIFPGPCLCHHVFPDYLGDEITGRYRARGIRIMAGEKPARIDRKAGGFSVRTESGAEVMADIVIAGIGIRPEETLAEKAGLSVRDGIVVNEYLQTSQPEIYAAGDNARFPYQALGSQMRVEHWDNAVTQGKWAGRNMAGANEPYTHMPYFYSDLFEFGYEAVGDVDSRLETSPDWTKENDTGVIYYLRDGRVRGAMMCNVWQKLDQARELIRRGAPTTPEALHSLIR